jgi:hypothetical protein
MTAILFAWAAIILGELAARRSGSNWWRAANVAGSVILTLQAWPEAIVQPVSEQAHAALPVTYVGAALGPDYHADPNCPLLNERLTFTSRSAAEFANRCPCPLCVKRVEASDLQTSLPGRGPP